MQPSHRQYPLSSSLEDLLEKTNKVSSENRIAALQSGSKTSIDRISKKSSSQEINLFLDESKYRTTDSKSSRLTSPSTRDANSSSRSSESIDVNRTRSGDEESSSMRTKRVNILASAEQPSSKQRLCGSSISFENDLDVDGGQSKAGSLARGHADRYLTMTGTIKRGKKKGQSMDLQLNISRDELEKISKNALAMQRELESAAASKPCCSCSLRTGVHILLLSLFSLPFVFLATSVYAFYIGTITWYNMFTYFNEEKSYPYKLLMSPLLVLTYPLAILLCTVGLAVYSALVQITTQFGRWSNEICDIEKGFYGWLCSFLKLSDCSPYEVVILTEIKAPDAPVAPANTSTEELSL